MKLSIVIVVCLWCADGLAQSPNYWSPVNEAAVGRDLFAASKSQRPTSFKLFQLNETVFRQYMRLAPSEKVVSAKNSVFIVSFPNADGLLQQFRVVDAPVMHP